MFGYLSNDRNGDQINLLILCAKWYIFQCAKNNKILNIYNFQKSASQPLLNRSHS